MAIFRKNSKVPFKPLTSLTGTIKLAFQARCCIFFMPQVCLAAHSANETNNPERTSSKGVSKFCRDKYQYTTKTIIIDTKLTVGFIINIAKTDETSPNQGTHLCILNTGR